MQWRDARNGWRVRLNGKDISLGTDEAEARKKYDEIIRAWLEAGRRLPEGGRVETVFDLAQRFTAHALSYYVKRGRPTAYAYRLVRALQLLEMSGHAEGAPRSFRPADLREYMAWLADDPEDRWSRDTINHYRWAVVAMLQWGVEHELVPPGVYTACRAVRPIAPGRPAKAGGKIPRRKAERTEIEEQEVLDVAERCPPAVSAMLRAQLLTGMRPLEVTGMRTGDLRPITIAVASGDSRVVWLYDVAPSFDKTSHHEVPGRVVPLDDEAMAIVRSQWDPDDPAAFVFSPRREESRRIERLASQRPRGGKPRPKPGRGGARIFGERYTTESYRRAVERACDRVHDPDGLRLAEGDRSHRWTPSRIRHSRATSAVDIIGIDNVMHLLGHRDMRTTMGYVNGRDRKAARAAASLADARGPTRAG